MPTLRPLSSILSLIALLWFAPAWGESLASVDAPAPAGAPAIDTVTSGTPSDVVENLQSGLLNIMKNADELGFQGRYDYMQPVVGEVFDVRFMGSKSVGRHWKKLDSEEQSAWLSMFARYLASNYAGNFKGWDGERFELIGEQPAAKSTRVVLTKLVVPGGEDVTFNYRLRQGSDGRWRIIDIYLKGTVSELALRRSDFSTTLKDRGFDELTIAMDEKIAELRKKGGG